MRLSCPVPSPLSLLLSGLLTILLLAGCMGGKQAVAPYPGRAQAEIAGTSRQAGQLVGATGPLSSGQATFSRDMLMPAVARINGRITAYEQKLQAWEEVNSRIDFSTLTPERISQFSSCRLQATDLLDDYKRLHDQLLNDQPMDVSRWLVSQSLPAVEKKILPISRETVHGSFSLFHPLAAWVGRPAPPLRSLWPGPLPPVSTAG